MKKVNPVRLTWFSAVLVLTIIGACNVTNFYVLAGCALAVCGMCAASVLAEIYCSIIKK